MKQVIFSILIVSVSLLCFSVSDTYAWPRGKPVTPYGDSCPKKCVDYGTCNTVMTDYDAEKALKDYYNRKGLSVMLEKRGERFIRARIYDEIGIVDIIIFDRRTGRIRSIY